MRLPLFLVIVAAVFVAMVARIFVVTAVFAAAILAGTIFCFLVVLIVLVVVFHTIHSLIKTKAKAFIVWLYRQRFIKAYSRTPSKGRCKST